VVYVGPFETKESCQSWKDEYELPFPVISDEDGAIFKQLSNGWVPYTILVGPDGKVQLWESEFDEAGFAAAVEKLYREPAEAQPEPEPAARLAPQPAGRAGAATIVILGGGAGGLVAAYHLRRRFSGKHRIVLVDRSPDHLFQSSLLWHMVGQRRADQIRRPLSDLTRRGIEFINDEVVEIDLANKLVKTHSEKIDFDYLIVSLGAQLVPETVEGFDEMALNLYDPKGAGMINAALESFSGGRVGVLVTSMPFKCPAAPYEAALLVDSFLRKKGVRNKSEIHVYTPEHQPMPVAGPVMGEAITKVLGKRDIRYHPLFTFEKMQPGTHTIIPSGGEPEKVDLLIAVPPHQAPDVVRSSGLIGASGWIPVDKHTLRTEHEGVYAIGDVNSVRLANGKTLPMAGVFAHYEAKVVAEQIATELQGQRSDAAFSGKGYCWLELGGGKAGFAGGNFYNEPEPSVRLYPPMRFWHWGKVLFEKWWLRHWF
jgi:sulfide:quinone oxidoreductase